MSLTPLRKFQKNGASAEESKREKEDHVGGLLVDLLGEIGPDDEIFEESRRRRKTTWMGLLVDPLALHRARTQEIGG
ncbi:hypothetical protein [Sandaracinus amylolyticus]|uniref:hypothetical protein n=1 Tax=Sandaracinus amylolyticus TaxID=927083 RepID=UPI001F370DCF|nr:hypothetical protein [Sandaracinus amylolyticus]